MNNPLAYTDPLGLQSFTTTGSYVNGIQVSPYYSMQMGPYSTSYFNTAVGQYMDEQEMRTATIENALTSLPSADISTHPVFAFIDMAFRGNQGYEAAREQLGDMHALAVSELNFIYSGENPGISYDPDKGLTDSFLSETANCVNNTVQNAFDADYSFFAPANGQRA